MADVRFGPWLDGLHSTEIIARLRSMRASAMVFCARNPEFADALYRAEGDTHALDRRRLLCAFAKLSAVTR